VEAFLRTRTGGEVYLPGVPLGELYGQELMEWLKKHHVNLQLGQAVRQVNLCRNRVDHLILRDGRSLQADAYVLAVAPHRLPALFEPGTHLTALEQVQRLEVSPITSVHFWHDRPITNLPHAVLFDRTAQWLFNRGAVSISPYSTMPEQDAYYTQVVISAARQLLPMGHDAIQHLIASELCEFFPEAQQARLLHCRVITEKTATFSVVPGIDAYRPHQATSIPNLFLAGDYTQTGWPATMEGAVRSGYLAAEQVIKHFSPVAGSC
ncbi:MAG TPA: FAD-dependent oxidoreductase, partial [Gemmatales bacterium]|nr:FAD-dependent oxidoreductase [Gemmatales bacterium]